MSLARDLANFPNFSAEQMILCSLQKRPSVEFLSGIKQASFPLPEFVETLSDGRIERGSNLGSLRKLGGLRPLGVGAGQCAELLQPLFANVSGEPRSVDQYFNERIARLYSKSWSAGLLKRVLVRDEPWLCTDHEVGITVDTLEGALEVIASIRRGGHHRIVGEGGARASRAQRDSFLGTRHFSGAAAVAGARDAEQTATGH